MALKKIDREFLVTDDSVNVYGFRLLTSGYLRDKFEANPIGFYMHAPKEMPREEGVLVRWSDLRQDGDKIYAKPSINLSHPRGSRTVEEVNDGVLNAASVGKIVVLEYSDAADLMLPGQTGPTITKWYNKELSLVDIPGNENALAPMLYDATGNEINLADFVHSALKKQPLNLFQGFNNKNFNSMDMSLKALLITSLALADNTTDDAIDKHLKDLVDKANKVPGLEKDLADMRTAKESAVKELADFRIAGNVAKLKEYADAGITAGKLTAAVAKDLSDKYADDPEGFKKVVDGLPVYKTASQRIAEGKEAVKDLADMSWDELDRNGKLPELKAADLDVFKAKFKAQFGTDWKGE